MKFVKFVSIMPSLVLAQAVSAHALSLDTVGTLPCSQVTQAGLARQSWSAGGAPYGAPLIEWNAQTFTVLRRRISECAGQSSGDVRGLLAYVQRLEGMVQLQNAQSQAAADRKARPQDNANLAAQRDAQSIADRERSQAAYERFVQRRNEEAASANSSRDNERELLAKVETFTSQDELKLFCKEVWGSQLSDSTRISVISNCKRRLQLMAISDRQQEEARQAEASRKLLPELIERLKQLPENEATLHQLRDLISDNHYRLQSLSFSDQNRYYQAIQSRLAEIDAKRTNSKCETVISKISIPNEIRDTIIIDGLGGISLAHFLCGPVLTTGNVSVVLGPNDTVDIKVDSLTLTFARRRYLSDRKVEVALNSPIQGGVNALVLTGAADGADRLAIGNPNFFVINFYSQFTPQVAAFLAQ